MAKKDGGKEEGVRINKPTVKSMSTFGAAIVAMALGLATLISGFFDDGPLKGLKKLIGRALLKISSVIFDMFAKPFKLLWKTIIVSVKSFVSTVWKSVSGFFGKIFSGAMKFVKNIFGGSKLMGKVGGLFKGGKGLISSFAGKLLKFVKPILKKIPGIGFLISAGFAFSRFKKGDIIGGLLDLASGIASIFPGIGTAVSIAIDVFSAYRDSKVKGVKPKKTEKGFWSGVWGWIKDISIKIWEGIKAGFGWVWDMYTMPYKWLYSLIGWTAEKVEGAILDDSEIDKEAGIMDRITIAVTSLALTVWDGIKGALGWIWDLYTDAGAWVMDFLGFGGEDEEQKEIVIEVPKSKNKKGIFETIIDTVKSFGENIMKGISEFVDTIMDMIPTADDVVKGFKNIVADTKNQVKDAFGTAANFFGLGDDKKDEVKSGDNMTPAGGKNPSSRTSDAEIAGQIVSESVSKKGEAGATYFDQRSTSQTTINNGVQIKNKKGRAVPQPAG